MAETSVQDIENLKKQLETLHPECYHAHLIRVFLRREREIHLYDTNSMKFELWWDCRVRLIRLGMVFSDMPQSNLKPILKKRHLSLVHSV